ncbi:MAG: hypothetical protein Q9166_000705 [cf. Caloplaca sp. 2 TL-2023]
MTKAVLELFRRFSVSLIFDNVEDLTEIERYIPPSQGPILLTTRSKDVAFRVPGRNTSMELETFNSKQSIELFNRLRFRGESKPSVSADEHSDGHTLGIEQMAAYGSFNDLTVRQLLVKYEKFALSMHKISRVGRRSQQNLDTFWALHLYEKGALNEALKLLDIAYEACRDRFSLTFAHLRNSAAVSFFELNELKQCKDAKEEVLQIRAGLGSKGATQSYRNLGNLASAQGRLDKALEYFGKAENASVQDGEFETVFLSVIHMVTGHVLYLKSDSEAALERYERSQKAFLKGLGPASQLHAQ